MQILKTWPNQQLMDTGQKLLKWTVSRICTLQPSLSFQHQLWKWQRSKSRRVTWWWRARQWADKGRRSCKSNWSKVQAT